MQEQKILPPDANLVLEHATPVAGFLTRPNAANNGNSPPGAYIWTGKFITKPGKASALIETLKANIPYIEAHEPDTISFLVLKGAEVRQDVVLRQRFWLPRV